MFEPDQMLLTGACDKLARHGSNHLRSDFASFESRQRRHGRNGPARPKQALMFGSTVHSEIVGAPLSLKERAPNRANVAPNI